MELAVPNKYKTLRMITTKRVRSFYEAFPDRAPVGSAFPDIELTTTDGTVISTPIHPTISTKHLSTSIEPN